MAKHPDLRTRAVHAGREPDPATRAIATPIWLSTTFERDADGTYPKQFAYTTFDNPNRRSLETAIADLSGGAAALSFASGMAAITAVLTSLQPGEAVLVSEDLFQGTARLLKDSLSPLGLRSVVTDTTDIAALEQALHGEPEAKLVWIDTPSNPMMRISDIQAVADIAHRSNAKLVVDNTFATFALQRPLELGADVVVESATKYISGHADVVHGIAAFAERGETYEHARAWQVNAGGSPSPFDCWLVHRGLPTLPLRLAAQSDSALQLARRLQANSAVSKVYYPGLEGHPGHDIASRQMSAFGGMLSIGLRGGAEAAKKVVANVKIWTRATSLGGVESLIEHRASSPIQTSGTGTGFQVPGDLIRLSVGLEHADDLLEDLEQAFGSSGLAERVYPPTRSIK